MLENHVPGSTTPSLLRQRWVCAGLVVLFLGAPAAATPLPWVISAGKLHQLDLESASFLTSRTIGVVGTVRALAQHPQGGIYALSETCCPSRQHLFIVEPSSGATWQLGSLHQAHSTIGGMATDARGRLWLAADGELWAIDAASGSEERWPVALEPGRGLLSVAAARGGLYGIVAPVPRDPSAVPQLVRIDVERHSAHVLRQLPELRSSVVSLAADAIGRFWLLEVVDESGTPPRIRHDFWRFDPSTGNLVSQATVSGSAIGVHFQTFAFDPRPSSEPPFTVPALETLVLVLLGIFLTATAQLFTQRRRQQASARG